MTALVARGHVTKCFRRFVIEQRAVILDTIR